MPLHGQSRHPRSFDNFERDSLIQMLQERVEGSALLRLIQKWLKRHAGHRRPGATPDAGTRQGGIVSPILATILCAMFSTYGSRKS